MSNEQIEMDFAEEDKHVCPRRAEGCIPGYRDFDLWEDGRRRWGSREHDRWPEQFERPRTCSYCGGVHVEDAFKLLEQGWELGLTGKYYKVYLEPPGTELYQKRLLNAIGNQQKEKEAFNVPMVSPIPPVKLYTHHATKEQIDLLNDIIRKQKSY